MASLVGVKVSVGLVDDFEEAFSYHKSRFMIKDVHSKMGVKSVVVGW